MQEPRIKRDFEKVKGDWEQICQDFAKTGENVKSVFDSIQYAANVGLGIFESLVEENKEALLARQRYLARLKEVQNLQIKMFTLGLTHNEKKRLNEK